MCVDTSHLCFYLTSLKACSTSDQGEVGALTGTYLENNPYSLCSQIPQVYPRSGIYPPIPTPNMQPGMNQCVKSFLSPPPIPISSLHLAWKAVPHLDLVLRVEGLENLEYD